MFKTLRPDFIKQGWKEEMTMEDFKELNFTEEDVKKFIELSYIEEIKAKKTKE